MGRFRFFFRRFSQTYHSVVGNEFSRGPKCGPPIPRDSVMRCGTDFLQPHVFYLGHTLSADELGLQQIKVADKTPYELLFGIKPRIPYLQNQSPDRTYEEYATETKVRPTELCHKAIEPQIANERNLRNGMTKATKLNSLLHQDTQFA